MGEASADCCLVSRFLRAALHSDRAGPAAYCHGDRHDAVRHLTVFFTAMLMVRFAAQPEMMHRATAIAFVVGVSGSRTTNSPTPSPQGEIGALLCRLAFRSHVRVLLRNNLQRGIIGEKAHFLRLRRSRVLRGTPQAPDSHSQDEHSSANGYEVFGHLLGLHIGCQAFEFRAGLAGRYAHGDRQSPGASSPRQNKFRRSAVVPKTHCRSRGPIVPTGPREPGLP